MAAGHAEATDQIRSRIAQGEADLAAEQLSDAFARRRRTEVGGG